MNATTVEHCDVLAGYAIDATAALLLISANILMELMVASHNLFLEIQDGDTESIGALFRVSTRCFSPPKRPLS
jgi:hypothetical protein